MARTEEVVVPVVCITIIFIFACVQIPLTGFGPLWAKKLWTKIIRKWKKGDKRPWDWTSVEEGVVYLSTLPRSAAELRELQGAPHNVGAVVSLNEGWEIVMGQKELDEVGMEWLHLPTPDYSSPDLNTVLRGVRFIDAQVKGGRAVLVHCNAGKGRSVVVTLAFLLLRHFSDGWDAIQAFEFVKSKRSVAKMRSRCGTHPQWRTVNSFYRYLRKRDGKLPEIKEPTRPKPAVLAVDPVDEIRPGPQPDSDPGQAEQVQDLERGRVQEAEVEEGGVSREVARGGDTRRDSMGDEVPRDWRGASSFKGAREGGGRAAALSPRLDDINAEGGEGGDGGGKKVGGGMPLPGTPFQDGGVEDRLQGDEG